MTDTGRRLESQVSHRQRTEIHFPVPTTRPRHLVTESDDLATALDAAAERWPGTSRAQLLVRLALDGHRAARDAQQERRDRRLELIRQHSGALTGVYARDEVAQLHSDWPA